VTSPKIELHVHLEGTVRPETVLEIARRNGHSLSVDSVGELRRLYEFRDFAHFLEIFMLTTDALQTADDFRQITVEYAEEAATHGAVYLEAIFSLGLWRGLDSDAVFTGCCDGADEARDRFGVEVRLTPDIARIYSADEAMHTARYAVKYRDRGVVGLGLGGDEVANPTELFAPAFELARAEGLASVPHAGEHVGPESIWAALDVLGADRIRHGITAVHDPKLMERLAGRGIVLDICPVSNVCTRAVPSLAEHPLPRLVEAGISCTISTDDPAMFGTDLTREYEAAASIGVDAQAAFEAGLEGALCDRETKARLLQIGAEFDWSSAAPVEVP
jgi:aminodeoxyfutalosine deaminase